MNYFWRNCRTCLDNSSSIMDFGLTAAVVRFYTKYKALNDKINMENVLAISIRCYAIITIILFIIGNICYLFMDDIFYRSMTLAEITSAKKFFCYCF